MINKIIGERIFDLRKHQNLTRVELGKLMDMHESTLQRYEEG